MIRLFKNVSVATLCLFLAFFNTASAAQYINAAASVKVDRQAPTQVDEYVSAVSKQCRVVTNNNNPGIFVPTNYRTDLPSEWQAFINADSRAQIPNVTLGSCVACVANQGASCTSLGNICGQTDTGTINCDGSCSAVIPPDSGCGSCVANQGALCIMTNICGASNTGTVACDGSCSVAAPSVPGSSSCVNYNACGMPGTAGVTDSCGLNCTSVPPSDSLCGAGVPCTVSNVCGQSASGNIVNGVCDAVAPPIPGVSQCFAHTGTCTDTGNTDSCGLNCNAVAPTATCGGPNCGEANSCNSGSCGVAANCGVVDCLGVLNGSATLDCNGVCNGGAQNLGCGCMSPAPSGCDNLCGSTKTNDCYGVCGGSATNQGCGCGMPGPSGCDNTCGSNKTNDCNNVCGGSATDAGCGCGNPPPIAGSCGGVIVGPLDCAGVAGGSAVDLGCGCNMPGPSGCDNACGSNKTNDCNNVCGGSASDAGCGCGMPGPSGCDSVCGSTKSYDCNNVCGGSASDAGCGCGNPADQGCGCGNPPPVNGSCGGGGGWGGSCGCADAYGNSITCGDSGLCGETCGDHCDTGCPDSGTPTCTGVVTICGQCEQWVEGGTPGEANYVAECMIDCAACPEQCQLVCNCGDGNVVVGQPGEDCDQLCGGGSTN